MAGATSLTGSSPSWSSASSASLGSTRRSWPVGATRFTGGKNLLKYMFAFQIIHPQDDLQDDAVQGESGEEKSFCQIVHLSRLG